MSLDRSATFKKALASNKITRVLLKWIDRGNYEMIKSEVKREKLQRRFIGYCPPGLQTEAVNRRRAMTGRVSCKHSGNAGDVIYALPAVRELGGAAGASLKLALNVPLRDKSIRHPLGAVQLNRKMYDMLAPLLSAQDYIKELGVHEQGSPVDYDLDSFRDSPLLIDRLGISRWYFYMFGLAADLSQPWLTVEPDHAYAQSIVVARSFRYRNLSLSHGFLEGRADVVFVGLREEYEDFKRQVPSARWVQVQDFLELARIVAGARLFIGNQSFPYSLAEGLKVRRVLELDPGMPNVVPVGAHAHDILFQRQFEFVADRLLGE
jgi:hypothetical protein